MSGMLYCSAYAICAAMEILIASTIPLVGCWQPRKSLPLQLTSLNMLIRWELLAAYLTYGCCGHRLTLCPPRSNCLLLRQWRSVAQAAAVLVMAVVLHHQVVAVLPNRLLSATHFSVVMQLTPRTASALYGH